MLILSGRLHVDALDSAVTTARRSWFQFQPGAFLCEVCMWLHGFSTGTRHIRLTGNSKFSIDVSVGGCASLCVGLAINW